MIPASLFPLPNLSWSLLSLNIPTSKSHFFSNGFRQGGGALGVEFSSSLYLHCSIYFTVKLTGCVSSMRLTDCSQLSQSLPCRISVWPQFTWVAELQPDCARAETTNDVREKLQTGLPREEFLKNQPCQTTSSQGFGQIAKAQDLFKLPRTSSPLIWHEIKCLAVRSWSIHGE